MKKLVAFIIFSLLILSFIQADSIVFSRDDKNSKLIECRDRGMCYDRIDEKCYSIGYQINGTYCSSESVIFTSPSGHKLYGFGFTNQSDSGKECMNDYECKSNFCFQDMCVGTEENTITSLNQRIDELEKKLEELEKKENDSQSPSITGNIIDDEETEEEFNIITNIFNWVKNLF